jgi:hypothetical protein
MVDSFVFQIDWTIVAAMIGRSISVRWLLSFCTHDGNRD